MPTGPETAAIVALSLVGALAQGLVAVRWYEPPARDGETPPAILEAGLFFVGFGLVFVLLGVVLSAVVAFARPYGPAVALLVTPLGSWLAYAATTDRLATVDEEVERFAGAVVGAVAAVYPVVLLAV